MARSGRWERGRACPLCPPSSDVDLLCYCKRVVHFNAEVAHGALDLGVPQQKLNGPQVAGTAVDQSSLGSSQRVRTEHMRV